MIITKRMPDFCAAHQLPTHWGACSNLHGHNYRVEVTVESPTLQMNNQSDFGMVIDFSELKQIYTDRVHKRVDHALLLGEVPLTWLDELLLRVLKPRMTYEEWCVQANEDSSYAKLFGIGKIAYLPMPVTTAEFLAEWIAYEMGQGLNSIRVDSKRDIFCTRVQVWETESGSAVWEGRE